MKKSYLMIAAAAALFAACAEKDTYKDVDIQESPIAFDQALYKTTRAYISDKATLAGEGGFIVYGYKKKTTEENWSNAQTIFNGVNVKSTDQGANWTYDNLRFWDKNGIYNFYAIAPYNPASGVNYSLVENSAPAALKFKITGAASAKSTDSDDYLIDRDGATNVAGSYTGTHDKVSFDFHHIMAKIDFKLKSTLASGTITVRKLVMTGWNSGAGTFTQSLTATPTALANTEWAIPTEGTGNITLVGTGASQNTVALTCSASATATDVTDWYIMVPQNIAANTLTFTVDYTYSDGNGYSETYDDQVAKLTAQQVWGTDSHITYTLDIKPEAIVFDVTSICGFDVVKGENVEVK